MIINCTDGEISLRVPVWELGVPHFDIMKRVFCSGDNGFNACETESEVERGRLLVTLPEKSAVVYRYCFKNGKN